jgi:hypothetical protein
MTERRRSRTYPAWGYQTSPVLKTGCGTGRCRSVTRVSGLTSAMIGCGPMQAWEFIGETRRENRRWGWAGKSWWTWACLVGFISLVGLLLPVPSWAVMTFGLLLLVLLGAMGTALFWRNPQFVTELHASVSLRGTAEELRRPIENSVKAVFGRPIWISNGTATILIGLGWRKPDRIRLVVTEVDDLVTVRLSWPGDGGREESPESLLQRRNALVAFVKWWQDQPQYDGCRATT